MNLRKREDPIIIIFIIIKITLILLSLFLLPLLLTLLNYVLNGLENPTVQFRIQKGSNNCFLSRLTIVFLLTSNSLRYILILSTHIHLDFPKDLFHVYYLLEF